MYVSDAGNPLIRSKSSLLSTRSPGSKPQTPIEAFYDLDNIAFSHLSCNCKAATPVMKKYSTVKERKRAEYEKEYSDPVKRERRLGNKRQNYRLKKRKDGVH
jgi:hypothetical protein